MAIRCAIGTLTSLLVAVHAVASPTYSVTDLGDKYGSYLLDNNGRLYGVAWNGNGLQYSDGFGPTANRAYDEVVQGMPVAVNAHGQVVSRTGAPLGGGQSTNRAVLTSPGSWTIFATLGGANAVPQNLNDAGQVVGNSDVASGQQHAFVSDASGRLTDLGTLPGGRFSSATAINNAGQIVGYADTGKATGGANDYTGGDLVLGAHAVVFAQGRVQDLGTLGGSSSLAKGINNAGTIVGTALTADGAQHAFMYKNGVMTDLGTLGTAPRGGPLESAALAVNNLGQIVGQSSYQAFVTDASGKMTDLNKLIPPGLGVSLWIATSINDLGQILAVGTTSGENTGLHDYLLTPTDLGTPAYAVPEPTALTMGLLISALWAARRAGVWGRMRRSS
jgi:probable HAF family extracellular repeat protein